MHFGDAARNAEVLHAHGENRIEIRGIEQLEEGALRIDARNDGFAGDLFAVGKNDARNGASFGADLLHLGTSTDFGTSRFSSFAKRARELAKPAARKRCGSNWMRISRGAKQQKRGRARGPRTKIAAEDAARGDGGADKPGG